MNKCFSLVFVLLLLCCRSQSYAQSDDGAAPFFYGADVSFLLQLEAAGVVFTQDGIPGDLLTLLKRNGINTIRLRLWHSPDGGVNDIEATLKLAERLKVAGLDLMLDIHYSDTWADPGRQTKPAAWDGLTFEVLKDSVYQYSYDVIAQLKNAGMTPRIVQVGNEIIQGMLWNDGRVGGTFDNANQWDNLASLLGEGIRGIEDALGPADSTSIMIHIDRGGDSAGARWFFDNLEAEGVPYDMIGLSYYPWWHGSTIQLEATLNTLANRYNKPIVLAETAYPWTLQWFDNTNNIVGLPEHVLPGYEATPDGQYAFLRDVIELVQNTHQGLGRGIFYWAPEYIPAAGLGSPWENVTLFDPEGETLVGLQAFFEASSVRIDQADPLLPALSARAYPNPFSEQTTLSFELPAESIVTLRVYHIDGRLVSVPVRQQPFGVGSHQIELKGAGLSRGTYLYRLTTDRGFWVDGLFVRR